MHRSIAPFAFAVAVSLLFAGCSANSPASVPSPHASGPSSSATAPSPHASTAKVPVPRYPHTGLDISGGGKFVNGAMNACVAEYPIVVKDQAQATKAKTGEPVASMLLSDGSVTYNGGWSEHTDQILNGIVSGTGTYSIRYSGKKPTAIVGSGIVVIAKNGKQSKHNDDFTFLITAHAHPDICLPGA